MFVAKANGQVVAYGRVIEPATDEAAPGTPAGYYLSGVFVDPAWRGRGIATALTRARLRWAFARTSTVFYVTGADNAASGAWMNIGAGQEIGSDLCVISTDSGYGKSDVTLPEVPEQRWSSSCWGFGEPRTGHPVGLASAAGEGIVTDLTLPLSADTVVSQLELAVGDMLLAEKLQKPTARAEESILLLTEQLYSASDTSVQSPSEEVLVVSEVRARLVEIWDGIRHWSKNVFSKSANWIESLATECLHLAKETGRNVADLLSHLHRRVMRWVIGSAITPKMTIGTTDGTVTLSPKSVRYGASLKVAPALAALDLAGVIGVLTGMLNMIIEVDVTYEVK